MLKPGWQARDVRLSSVTLRVVEAGAGPVVLLLHGFPDHWGVWRGQIDGLVAQGFRVVAPDLRGYGASGKPDGTRAYTLDVLAGDVKELVEALGAGPVTLVGHDWGGVVAWATAARHPEVLDRLVILNAPHPFVDWGAVGVEQLLKSGYIAFFQLPLLPEGVLSAFGFAAMRALYQQESLRRGAITPEDVEESLAAIAAPNALTSALNYYRAVPQAKPLPRELVIEKPVRVLWGDRDPVLGAALAAPPANRVPTLEVLHRHDASHWLQLDEPDWVVDRIAEFARA